MAFTYQSKKWTQNQKKENIQKYFKRKTPSVNPAFLNLPKKLAKFGCCQMLKTKKKMHVERLLAATTSKLFHDSSPKKRLIR